MSKPDDLVRASIPFSYMAVTAASTDGKPHTVQVYSDISAEWVTGDNSKIATWSTSTGNIITHQIQLKTPYTFAEANEHIECKYHGSDY